MQIRQVEYINIFHNNKIKVRLNNYNILQYQINNQSIQIGHFKPSKV